MEQYPYRCAVCRQSLSLGGIISYDIKFSFLFQELRKAAESGKVEYINSVKIELERQEANSPEIVYAPGSSSLLSRRNLKLKLSPIADSTIVNEVLAKSRMSLSSLGTKRFRQEDIYSPLEMVKSGCKMSHKSRMKK